MIDTAIIILNYRTADLTAACLDSIAEHGDPHPMHRRVIVVDNDSRDGSAERLVDHVYARNYGWATVVSSPINGGFSAGNNFGMRQCPARAYVLLNSDTIVHPGLFERLFDRLYSDDTIGMVAPAFVDETGAVLNSIHRHITPLSELLRAANTGVLNKILRSVADEPTASTLCQTIDWAPFACVAIKKEVVERVGYLDDGYFMYFEDMDYCARVRAAGYSIVHEPDATVTHICGGSSGITDSRRLQKRAPRYYYEARTRFFAKHYGAAGLAAANAAWIAGRTIGLLRRSKNVREREGRDIWTNALHPFRPSGMMAKV